MPPGDERTGDSEITAPVDASRVYTDARRHALDRFEREYVKALVELHGGNVTRAAEPAELDRACLYKLIRRHRGPRG